MSGSAGARRVGFAFLVVLLAGLVAWLGTRLWGTIVPSGLPERSLDVAETFGATRVAEAQSFEELLRWLTVGQTLTEIAVLAVWAWIGVRWMRESAAGPIGTGFLLAMLGLAVVWVVQLPFLLVGQWWLRDHDVTDVDYLSAVAGSLTGLGSTFVSVCSVLAIAMGFARVLRWSWWIPTAAVFVAVFALVGFLSPLAIEPLFDDASPRIQREADRYAEIEGLDEPIPVSVWDADEFEDQPNAFAFGLGPTRRIVLFGALVDQFSNDETDAVVAHEVGHHAHDHLLKGVGWSIVVALLSGLIVALATVRRGGMGRPEAVPVALLVFTIVSLAVLPLESTSSRRYEAEADWAALEATRDPEAFEAAMKELTRASLSDPDPPGWFHVIFDSHPSMKDRVEMARAWARLND